MRGFVSCLGVQCACQQAITAGPMGREGLYGYPPPPRALCRPKFQPPQSEGAGRGLVPFSGTNNQGSIPFATPPPRPLTEAGPNG